MIKIGKLSPTKNKNKIDVIGKIVGHYDVIQWKLFPRYWTFVRGIHRLRWIPHIKVSDAELWRFLWSEPEQKVEQTIETLLIWDAIAFIMISL